MLKSLAKILPVFVLTIPLFAMPPTPGVVERLREDGRLDDVVELHRDARARGMNRPFEFNLAELPRDDADEVVLRAICILADFDDNEADRDARPAGYYDEMLFSRGEFRTGSMRDWYLENSYGQVDIQGEVHGWYRMPRDYEYYVAGRQGFGAYPRNAQGLTRDALLIADRDVEYSDFDNNGNGVVEALFIVHAGPGAESTRSDDMIWSHAWQVPGNVVLDGMRFSRYAMEPENGRIGVFGHEIGHSLFGLPDLYDTEYESAGIGMWSMMAGGSHGGNGNYPVHFDAWCKMWLGFVEPFPIIRDYESITLEPAISDEGDVLKMWRDGEWDNEYFLVENRQKIGSDRAIPGSGVLIWHCDDVMRNNSNPWYPGRPPGNHNIVALEQADGDFDMEHNRNSGDVSDPFPGSSWASRFGDDTEPSSRDYRNYSTDITLYNFERVDSLRMRFGVSLDPEYRSEQLRLFVLNRIPEDHRYPDPDIRREEVMVDEFQLLQGVFREAGVWDYQTGFELPEDLTEFNTVLYIESWREGDEPDSGLTRTEQVELSRFLDRGGYLFLIGPDIATNLLRGNDNPLWEYLHADYVSGGAPAEETRLRVMSANEETRIAGQTFPYSDRGMCDHYVDEVEATDGAFTLFNDRSGAPHGVIYADESGYRVVLQSFLFGGLIDYGGHKVDLVTRYFEFLWFQLAAPETSFPGQPPEKYRLLSAYPNPFNDRVRISFDGGRTPAFLTVYNEVGREVGRLQIGAGRREVAWKPLGLAAGSYFMRWGESGEGRFTRLVYLK